MKQQPRVHLEGRGEMVKGRRGIFASTCRGESGKHSPGCPLPPLGAHKTVCPKGMACRGWHSPPPPFLPPPSLLQTQISQPPPLPLPDKAAEEAKEKVHEADFMTDFGGDGLLAVRAHCWDRGGLEYLALQNRHSGCGARWH